MADLSKVRRKLQAVPKLVKEEVVKQIEKEARKLVAQMNSLKPIPEITIDWTWGSAPAGSVSIGQVKGNKFDQIAVTVYATAHTDDFPGGFAGVAQWFEFGTNPRTQKTTGRYTGFITASPYFYPTWRGNRDNIKTNLRNAVKRGVKRADKL